MGEKRQGKYLVIFKKVKESQESSDYGDPEDVQVGDVVEYWAGEYRAGRVEKVQMAFGKKKVKLAAYTYAGYTITPSITMDPREFVGVLRDDGKGRFDSAPEEPETPQPKHEWEDDIDVVEERPKKAQKKSKS
jgi:hypothetical protein